MRQSTSINRTMMIVLGRQSPSLHVLNSTGLEFQSIPTSRILFPQSHPLWTRDTTLLPATGNCSLFQRLLKGSAFAFASMAFTVLFGYGSTGTGLDIPKTAKGQQSSTSLITLSKGQMFWQYRSIVGATDPTLKTRTCSDTPGSFATSRYGRCQRLL